MKRLFILSVIMAWLVTPVLSENRQWDLNRCLAYARKKNITIRSLKLDKRSDAAMLEKARAARVPDLKAGASYSLSRAGSQEKYGSSSSSDVAQRTQFSLSSGVTLFNGFKTGNEIRQQKKQIDLDEVTIEKNIQSVEIAVTQAYLQVLFAHESVKNAENNVNTTASQLQYTRERFKVGSAPVVELEHMRSQAARDEYDLVIARNALTQRTLELKQLLELPPQELFSPFLPALSDSIRLPVLPDKDTLFQRALKNLPQIKESRLAIDLAEIERKKSVSGYYPALSLSGNLSSTYNSTDSDNFSTQMSDNFSPGIGAQLSVPLQDNKQTKTAKTQADIAFEKAHLLNEQRINSVLMDVEKAYLNTRAAYNRYQAAIVQMRAAHTSYKLSRKQYELGMLKPTELLVQRDLYLDAQQELTQAKYSALLHYQVLMLYEGKPVTVPEEFSLKE